MSKQKVIVCLANSRKHSGRCIAGVEVSQGQPSGWIRPVSARAGAEVSEHERHYEDGSDPRVLDVISVPLIAAAPDGYQSENWLLDPERYWVLQGRVTWEQLDSLRDPAAPLWPSEAPSTYHGIRDRVTAEEAEAFGDSLRLVHVDGVQLRVFAPSAAFGNPKRAVQATFTHLDTRYALKVTDPLIEREYLVLQPHLF